MFHLGEPLVDYDLTCVEQSGVGDRLPHNNDVDTPHCSLQSPSVHQGLPSLSPCSHSGPPSQQGLATVESSQEPGLATTASTSIEPSCSGYFGENVGVLLDAVLFFINAYHLKGDNDSLRLVVIECFPQKNVFLKLMVWSSTLNLTLTDGIKYWST